MLTVKKRCRINRADIECGVVYTAKSLHGEQLRVPLEINEQEALILYLNERLEQKTTTVFKWQGWVYGRCFPSTYRIFMEEAYKAYSEEIQRAKYQYRSSDHTNGSVSGDLRSVAPVRCST